MGPTRTFTCAALLLASGHAACAQAPADTVSGQRIGEELALIDQESTKDRVGRIVTDAFLNGHGPLRLILDTGANRSAISMTVAATLGVGASGHDYIDVHGVTGPARVPVASIKQMQVGALALDNLRLPILHDDVFAGADGILGIDNLQHARVEIDFREGRVLVSESKGRSARRGYLLVRARLQKRRVVAGSWQGGPRPGQGHS